MFWNARTKKIYSNVDSKIVQNDGRDVFIGEGFESDEEFKDWRFRRMKGAWRSRSNLTNRTLRRWSNPLGRTSICPALRQTTLRQIPACRSGCGAARGTAFRGAAFGCTKPVRPDGEEGARPAEPIGEIQPLRRAVHADEAGE